MALFKGRKEKTQALMDRIEYLEQLPVAELADDLMQGAWGPEGAKPDGETLTELEMIRTIATSMPPPRAIEPLQRLVARGMTALEITGLAISILGENSDSSNRRWEPTGAGREALAEGSVAERVSAAHPSV